MRAQYTFLLKSAATAPILNLPMHTVPTGRGVRARGSLIN